MLSDSHSFVLGAFYQSPHLVITSHIFLPFLNVLSRRVSLIILVMHAPFLDKTGKNEELGTLVRSTRLAVPNYLSGGVITCLAVDDKLNMAAIGFSNHCLLLLRGDITRDRGTKQKILDVL